MTKILEKNRESLLELSLEKDLWTTNSIMMMIFPKLKTLKITTFLKYATHVDTFIRNQPMLSNMTVRLYDGNSVVTYT